MCAPTCVLSRCTGRWARRCSRRCPECCRWHRRCRRRSCPCSALHQRRRAPRHATAARAGGWRRPASAVLAAGLLPWMMPSEQIHGTGHAELRDLVLPDQTQVRLNADSRLRVRMGWFGRQVELLQGEATFDIARDRRPFEVEVNGLEIRDIGTVFDVSRRLQSTRIGVVSGEVEVWRPGRGRPPPGAVGAGPGGAGRRAQPCGGVIGHATVDAAGLAAAQSVLP